MSKRPDLVFQEVDIQDVLMAIINLAVDGHAYTSAGRCLGNIEGIHRGEPYTLSISITSDSDDSFFDESLPWLDFEKLEKGKAVVRAPAGWLPSSRVLSEDELSALTFPEAEEEDS